MNYSNVYRKKSSLAKVILSIIFLSFIIELNAQKNDSIASVSEIAGVEINSNLNTSKYLWNLLKENYSIKIQDTTVFYTIDYKVEVPDSNYFQHFTGVIIVEYKDNKSTVFVCEGSYNDSNIINYMNFRPFNFYISGTFEKRKIEKYRKFKKHKMEYDNILNSFKIIEKAKKRSITSVAKFDNRLLSSYELVFTIRNKGLSYEINYIYNKGEFDKLSIVDKKNIVVKYKFKKVNAIMSLHIESTNSINYIEKYKIVSITPSSLNDILKDTNK